jgi:hypothetical protein
MAIFNLYSKRLKKLKGEVPDVYKYDIIPQTLRVQIVHIIRDVIGKTNIQYMTIQELMTSYKIYYVENMVCLN